MDQIQLLEKSYVDVRRDPLELPFRLGGDRSSASSPSLRLRRVLLLECTFLGVR